MEIAKLRAARIIWCKLIEQFSPKKQESKILRTHCQTSGWSLQATEPYNNIVRTTIEAMASIFGGTQSLHTNSFDEALALPTDFSANIARNTQLILQNETGITNVIDPFGGSYLIEKLTKQLIEKANYIINKINSLGGMTKAIIEGYPKQWIEESAIIKQAHIDSNNETIIGLNKYKSNNQVKIKLRNIDNNIVYKEQIKNLKTLKNIRDNKRLMFALKNLEIGAKQNKNLLDLCIDAIRVRATIGEISHVLEKVFTRFEQHPKIIINAYKKNFNDQKRLTNFYKKIEIFIKKEGRRPRILIAKLGQDGHDRGAKVISSSFADFGFDVDISSLFQTPQNIAKHAIENDVHIVGISSLAAAHNNLIPQLLNELKKRSTNKFLVVVGGIIPKNDHYQLRNNGVNAIFTPGTKLLDSAEHILQLLQSK